MNISFRISIGTVIFTIFLISSAAYMRNVLNFIKYHLAVPSVLSEKQVENIIIKKPDPFKEVIPRMYEKHQKKSKYWLIPDVTKEQRISLYNNFKGAGWGEDKLILWIWYAFALAGTIFFIYIIRLKINPLRLIPGILIIGAGIYYAFTINTYVIERIHIILFGLTGFLFAKDNVREKNIYAVIFSLVYCFAVSSADETFQFFLPDRVGDVRDIIFGTVGGTWGAAVLTVMQAKISRKKADTDVS